MSTNTFTSNKSIAHLATIAALATDGRHFTTFDAMAATGLGESAAGNHIRHLVRIKKVYRAVDPQPVGRNNRPGEYALGSDPVLSDTDVSDSDDFPRRVIVLQQWAPNHVRMPLECLLFGVPKILQGIHA
jgi:hypothetical protein